MRTEQVPWAWSSRHEVWACNSLHKGLITNSDLYLETSNHMKKYDVLLILWVKIEKEKHRKRPSNHTVPFIPLHVWVWTKFFLFRKECKDSKVLSKNQSSSISFPHSVPHHVLPPCCGKGIIDEVCRVSYKEQLSRNGGNLPDTADVVYLWWSEYVGLIFSFLR